MKQTEIILIAAVSENNVIGLEGMLPWHKDRKKNKDLIKADFDHFKGLTMGYPIIMGRATYLSIPESKRPLEGRHNLVLTHDTTFSQEGVYVAHSLKDALDVLQERSVHKDGIDYSRIFIGGGQQVYEAAMDYATSLEITHVHQQVPQGKDMRYFPSIDLTQWKEEKPEDRSAQGDKPAYSFVTYKRK